MKTTLIKNKKKVNLFKHLFVSGRHNKHSPHILRDSSLILIFFVASFALGASYGTSFFFKHTVLGASIESNILIDYTNEDRVKEGLPVLHINSKLNQAAKFKNEDMIKNEYFAHNSPAGLNPWYFIEIADYKFEFAGENLARNFTDSKGVVEGWMNSPTHRENMLSPKFRDIGINVSLNNKNNSIYVVQMFGKPAVEDLYVPQEKIEDTRAEKKDIPVVQIKKPVKVLQHKATTSFVNTKSESTSTPVEEPIKNDLNLPEVAGIETYSNFFDRIIFNLPFTVQYLLYLLSVLILTGLGLLLFAEFKKHHRRHFFLGILMVCLLLVFVYFNANLVL